jgi:CDP-6-deoxy-D-xylo-4-hexulose-3-dehydrase
MKYPLASSTWGIEEIETLEGVISKGTFTMGERVKNFEEEFADYFNVNFSVMVNSGSSANLLMLQALKYSGHLREDQTEIIVPAVSWSTTFFPINQSGFKIIFVDIDVNTFNIDTSELKKYITKKTAAILSVNLLGSPSNLIELKKICKEFSIFLLEDNCESMGSSIEGKFAGSFGLMGTFSTFYSHHICTMEGGLIVTDDEKLYEILVSLRAHGWVRELKNDNSLYPKSGNNWQDSFKFILPGFNVRPLEMEGALGTIQLKKLDSFVENRRENALHLQNRLSNSNVPLILQKDLYQSSWFGFGFILNNTSINERNSLVDFLSHKGIESRPIVAGNFTKNPVIKYLDYEIKGELRNANHIHDKGFFIGNHHYPILQEIDYFIESVSEFANTSP